MSTESRAAGLMLAAAAELEEQEERWHFDEAGHQSPAHAYFAEQVLGAHLGLQRR